MSRYNNPGTGNGSSGNYDDDITLKLQKYAALEVVGDRVNAFDSKYGNRFVVGFEDVHMIDGIVFQRNDSPDTWKVFSAGKFFNLNPEDGLVYETYDEEDGYSNEMSAEDILNHPRVVGFSETFGDDDYFYKPVGVVIEEGEDIATNDEMDVTVTERPSIEIGKVSMLLANKSWARTLARKLTTRGPDIIDDENEYEKDGWLTTDEPELRSELDGRTMELWLTEEPKPDEEEDGTYTTANVLDVKTGNHVTIDNGVVYDDDDEGEPTNNEAGQDAAAEQESDEPAADPEPAEAAADGGTQSIEKSEGNQSSTSTDEQSQSSEPDGDGGNDSSDGNSDDDDSNNDSSDDESEDPLDDIPDVLDQMIDYFARTQESATPDELREFAGDDIDNPEEIDWEAASDEVEARA